MTCYLVHWLEGGAHTSSTTTRADTLTACGASVHALALAFASELASDDDSPEDFATRVQRDTLAELVRLEPGRADDPHAPSVIVDFPVRVQTCVTVWATPRMVVVPVQVEAVQ